MIRSTNFNNDYILKVLVRKKLITNTQLIYLKSVNSHVIEILVKDNWIDNESLLNILSEIYPNIIFIDHIVKIENYTALNQYILHGYFIYEEREQIIAVNNLRTLLKVLKNTKSITIKLIKAEVFFNNFEHNFARINTAKAKYLLNFLSPSITAKNIPYFHIVSLCFVIFFTTFFIASNVFFLINNCAFFIQNLLKLLLFYCAISRDIQYRTSVIKNFPMYTILVPLYKEISKLDSIIYHISSLNYPKNRLDVKLIVEADDQNMINALAKLSLDHYIHVIQVPYSHPRTKPKALNYAMQYVKGKYIVIYDAEDQPAPNQLLKAINAFNTLPKEYACVQAKLNFYNANENLLTKLFSIEYSLWFEYLLKGLHILQLPSTLGGTSNHFKTTILKKVGMWDAYNVTEDADIGIRLGLKGYKIAMIDSYTLEEATIDMKGWLHQRSRWIKGFMQTTIVFIMQSKANSHFRSLDTIVTYIFVALSVYSFICLPWLLIISFIQSNQFIKSLWLYNSIFAIVYVYSAAIYVLIRLKKGLGKFNSLDYIALTLWPLYFLLHTIASYKAIWEIIKTPFKWNKTNHGITNNIDND